MAKKIDDDDDVSKYLLSKQFQIDFAKQVKKDTWEKGFPMVYADKDGNIVEHWKDGTIKILGHVDDHKKT